MSDHSYLIISDLEEPTRLDRYLKRIFINITQGVIEGCLRKGKIKVNGAKAKANLRVQNNDELRFFDATIWNYQASNSASQEGVFSSDVIALAGKMMGEYLLMDHDEFLAINKPANLAVQGGSKIKLSIDDALSYLSLNSCKQYKLVHRLDKETSGVLLIAKGYAAANRLTRAFKERRMHKTYLAVLSGQITKQEGVVRGKLQYSKAGQGSEEKYAESLFKVIGSGEVLGRVCSALEFQPVTGRMHQLRIHSVMLGAPILGDKKYGGWPYKRLMLHAKALVIAKEVFGQEILLQAPVPEGFTGYMT